MGGTRVASLEGVGEQRAWIDRLTDTRSRRVIFVAHCVLNENTRYLGGACRPGAIPEIVEACLQARVGIVQLPCPEQAAWGGVLKRRLLRLYGTASPVRAAARRFLLPMFMWYTRRVYKRLAADIAMQMKDYREAGCAVMGVIGVDGSPSCGVCTTLDVRKAVEGIARLRVATATSDDMNAIVKGAVCDGPGLFTRLLRNATAERNQTVPFAAHDLIRELTGEPLGDPVATLLTEPPNVTG